MYDNVFGDYMAALNPAARDAVGGFFGYYGGPPSSLVRNPDGSVNYTPSYGNPYAAINPFAYRHISRENNPGDMLMADVIRAQTADYATRYAPLEDFLASEITATGTRALAGDLDRTRQYVMGSAENIQGQQNRQLQRLGLAGDSSLASSNTTVSAMVGGLNDTRLRDIDRRERIISGGLGPITARARGAMA